MVQGVRNSSVRAVQRAAVGVVLAIGGFVSGCAKTTPDNWAAFLKAHEHRIARTEARIEPGDTIFISSPRVFEIDGTSQRVDPDGTVTLELIGKIKLAGLTTKEAVNKVEEAISPYYVDPDVQVQITSQPRSVIYVLGQVGSPGPRIFTGNDTLMHTLAVARPNDIAWKSRIKVIRPSAFEDRRREITVNVDKMVKTGDLRSNILLEPGDVIYVPPTPLGWVGLRIRELLFPITPALRAYQTPDDFIAAQEVYDDSQRRSRGRRTQGRR